MSAADAPSPVTDAEAAALFADLAGCGALVLAVSGGPDSTALLVLAARWRAALKEGPGLLAVTVDHGLRPEARREAAAVKRLAARLGIAHRTLRWMGPKPTAGLQEAARVARYRLLATAARNAGARHVLTAHTLDDQAETVLFRLARGSGLSGLGAMARIAPLPVGETSRRPVGGTGDLQLVRPFLEISRARLIATMEAAGVSFIDDPSNRDPRFTRVRLRALMPLLGAEGLSASRLAQFASRARRADAAIEAAVDALAAKLALQFVAAPAEHPAPIAVDAAEWAKTAAEIRLRFLGRLIAAIGDEGPVELGKLEACEQAVMAHRRAGAPGRFRRTLAGAVVTLAADRLTVARAPPRRNNKARHSVRRVAGSAEKVSVHQASAK